MAETTQFTIGAEAHCTDGVCGEVSRVVVDPVAQTVTHLVVEPKGREGLGRLVRSAWSMHPQVTCGCSAPWPSSSASTRLRKPSSYRAVGGTRPTGPSR